VKEERHATLRVHVRKVPEAVRADHDDLGAREGEGPVPDVREQESHAAAQRLYGADEEEELSVVSATQVGPGTSRVLTTMDNDWKERGPCLLLGQPIS